MHEGIAYRLMGERFLLFWSVMARLDLPHEKSLVFGNWLGNNTPDKSPI